MGNDNTKPLGRVIGIDEGRIERHVSELVRGATRNINSAARGRTPPLGW